jgi:hypothetical protein
MHEDYANFRSARTPMPTTHARAINTERRKKVTGTSAYFTPTTLQVDKILSFHGSQVPYCALSRYGNVQHCRCINETSSSVPTYQTIRRHKQDHIHGAARQSKFYKDTLSKQSSLLQQTSHLPTQSQLLRKHYKRGRRDIRV